MAYIVSKIAFCRPETFFSIRFSTGISEIFSIEWKHFAIDDTKGDMFFEGKGVSVSLSNGYGKSLIYQAAPVIDRLASLE